MRLNKSWPGSVKDMRVGLLTALFVAATPIASQAAAVSPIEAQMASCLHSPQGSTTQGMIDCTQAAYAGYDRELNQLYTRVTNRLDPPSRLLLRDSQRRWLDYRSADRKALNGPFSANRGSLFPLQAASADLDAIKARIGQLHLFE